MHVTVVICTWNRAKLLDQTLTQFSQLRIPEGVTWELLVVNNNCTDDTDQVLARHTSRLPLRRLFEPKQGLSNARNCAMAAATGDLLLWTDDDVLLDPNWLVAYVEAARAWPDATFFGGPIEPWFGAEPPVWMQRHLPLIQGALALLDLGPETVPMQEPTPFGANMAFRLERIRGRRFDTRLGRVAHGMLSGDETSFISDLKHDGHTGIWIGSARVRHYITPERLTERYVYRFYQGIGQGNARLEPHTTGRTLFGIPFWALRQYVEATAVTTLLRPWKSEQWVRMLKRSASLRGAIAECRRDRATATPDRPIVSEPT